MKIQITLFHKEGKYKPMSTLLEVKDLQEYKDNKAELQKKAIMNIAHQRKMTPQDIIKLGYTGVKVREYDIEKIKAEQEQKRAINRIRKMAEKRKNRLAE